MSDSEGEEKGEVFDDIILKLKENFGDDCKQSTATLERFALANAHSFCNVDPSSEYKLEHHMLHQKYLRVWESEMVDFLHHQSLSMSQLFEQMEDAKLDRYTALFEEHQHHAWVDSILAVLSFEYFVQLMSFIARRQTTTEGKESEETKHEETKETIIRREIDLCHHHHK
mmetsp:Transcript_9244/g.14237  ORF Transcript_9244/g.14237 Transcript_9244/m.14237 type:complete len:170 (+) Transcript_9244:91-600(+)|eukprot:CAMPEP_0197308982 /NCGR_PEP_ID=MMETSP0891-20130614/7536_1 /TAXON_ID=44058 ORGANISM="Aureoumbra lagunensis, Strain CCMP1510" /NCGR_SAMPLE_ID=MMETSP0891 /ASSEMBLY_ACC=CAM_ASM_000534 /LENGTH=169 /DNA_ID=CAMNT_0042793809 /DNA_START=78 /DNA_END=587 /DNA_ORIENTATION=-